MTKFKSQGLYFKRIKYWNSGVSGPPPSLIPALRKIAILGLKTGLWQWYSGISVHVKDICLVARKISVDSRSNLWQKESELRIEMTDKVDLEVIEAFKLFDKVGVP